MADSDLKTILARLTQIERANRAPVWEWILKAMIPVVAGLVVWGVSVETRMARMDADITHSPSNGLREDVRELKADLKAGFKDLQTRMRALEMREK